MNKRWNWMPEILGAGALVGLLAAVTFGCGAGEEKVAQKSEPLRVPVEQTTAVPAAAPAALSGEAEGEVVASSDSLAPEVEVEVADTKVDPGAAVEISALASPDVREVILSDGRGKTTSFAYDLQAKAWKAFYRVPMKMTGDRLGLSVTAKNGANRWHRVWLFLEKRDPTLSTSTGVAAPDSIH